MGIQKLQFDKHYSTTAKLTITRVNLIKSWFWDIGFSVNEIKSKRPRLFTSMYVVPLKPVKCSINVRSNVLCSTRLKESDKGNVVF